MPMSELQVGDQTVRYDRKATAVAYGGIKQGGAGKCGCFFCRNFAVQRSTIFTALLEQRGVDPNKEEEVFEYGPKVLLFETQPHWRLHDTT
jgi:hypothetical protein